ncbi:hypothetical protein Hokovirus_1_9 [Hokovirus HKV1]|uniref:Uncharacterized protein n=1 Tax=Hokovirus HKV1 TaxID=1977638 RepID=A0A1V0SEH5_9VIRU|nr:hypothetical protein Hokovirus_1_9 [Hokovirus HKV1]
MEDIKEKNNKSKIENIKFIANSLFVLTMFIYMTIYFGFAIYFVSTQNFATVIMSPFIYSEPDRSNSTIFMTPCFIGADLLEKIKKNNETLPNNYIQTYDIFLFEYYYLDTDYCNELDFEISNCIDNINTIMNNKLYLEINYNMNYLIIKCLIIAFIICVMFVCCFTSYWCVNIKPSYWLIAIVSLLGFAFVITIILPYIFIQESLTTYQNFDYISNFLHVQNSNIYSEMVPIIILLALMIIIIASLIIVITDKVLKHY